MSLNVWGDERKMKRGSEAHLNNDCTLNLIPFSANVDKMFKWKISFCSLRHGHACNKLWEMKGGSKSIKMIRKRVQRIIIIYLQNLG